MLSESVWFLDQFLAAREISLAGRKGMVRGRMQHCLLPTGSLLQVAGSVKTSILHFLQVLAGRKMSLAIRK